MLKVYSSKMSGCEVMFYQYKSYVSVKSHKLDVQYTFLSVMRDILSTCFTVTIVIATFVCKEYNLLTNCKCM